jgi:hypothetical protein
MATWNSRASRAIARNNGSHPAIFDTPAIHPDPPDPPPEWRAIATIATATMMPTRPTATAATLVDASRAGCGR